MKRYSILAAILVLALATIACGININMPVTQLKTGPTETQNISIPELSNPQEVPDLTLAFGAGDLNVGSGATENLVEGTSTYNVADFKPEVKVDGSHITLEQGNLNVTGIPNFSGGVKNTWDLKLSNTPMKLTIKAGAYNGTYDLGGLALQDLSITDGASHVNLDFSKPNTADMDTFNYSTGASDVSLTNLANANLSNLVFKSGAGSYELDFSGDLKRDAYVSIDSGISSFKIIVPEKMSAQVSFEGALSSVNTQGAWQKQGNVYSQTGTGPGSTIHITVKMGAGSLDLLNH